MNNPLISLCMIVGNAEEYIGRCLRSFLVIADEVVIVRAVGSQTPDRTIQIARDMLPAWDVPLVVGEYSNKAEHEDWPHVDDFSAARQKSFDLASGKYCFWVDTDDVLGDGSNGKDSADIVQRVLELAKKGEFTAYVFPYRIFARGVTVPRERMVLRTSGKWRYPVHECFTFHQEPVSGMEDQRVVVTHLPHFETKSGSNERNLRILKSIPADQMTPGLLYHLHGEYMAAGDILQSIATARRALSMKELGRPERYEILLNLARAGKSPGEIESVLVQAYGSDPRRREALGLLTCLALDCGENEIALAYARQMMATEQPASVTWNNRAGAYGWLGDDIYAQALRASGYWGDAEMVRRDSLRRSGGARIALIHATRGRPQQAAMARKVWLDYAERPDQVEHIFCIDQDDEESKVLQRLHHIDVPAGGGCVAAWNLGAQVTEAGVMIQMSDDWTPPPMWDRLLLDRIGDPTKPKVLAISDGLRSDSLLCMAICTRAYYCQDMFLFHPEFLGVYSDNWFTEVAYRRHQVIEARDLVFLHEHPCNGNKGMDATYLAQNSPERYRQGEEVLLRMQAGNNWESVPGWFNYYDFYGQVADGLRDGDTIAEIGTWKGRSLIFMAQRLQRQGKRVKILAVDTFRGELGVPEHQEEVQAAGGSIRGVFEANLARCGVSGMVEIIEGDSAANAHQVRDISLAACFIDGAHDYESVKRDVAAWRSKVRTGGILAGHDIHAPDVVRAVKEALPEAQLVGPVWRVQL